MEDMVAELVEQLCQEKRGCCPCANCRADVMAMALNQLPPKYVVTQKGAAFTKLQTLDLQFKTDVVREVLRAISKIAKSPRHG